MDVSDKRRGAKSTQGNSDPPSLEASENEARDWLDSYERARESRDLEAALALFAPDVRYCERRFAVPLQGRKTLESYWRDCIFEHQRDICFDYQFWGVRGNETIALWQATYTWLPINGIMRADGVCHVVFSERENGRLICGEYNEWFDLIEV